MLEILKLLAIAAFVSTAALNLWRWCRRGFPVPAYVHVLAAVAVVAGVVLMLLAQSTDPTNPLAQAWAVLLFPAAVYLSFVSFGGAEEAGDTYTAHEHDLESYPVGVRAGQRLELLRTINVTDHNDVPTGEVHTPGEIWRVATGCSLEPEVIWLVQPDGDPHAWEATDLFQWFKPIDPKRGGEACSPTPIRPPVVNRH